MKERIHAAELRVNEAFSRLEVALEQLENPPDGANEEQLDILQRTFDEEDADHKVAVERLERLKLVAAARDNLPVPLPAESGDQPGSKDEPAERSPKVDVTKEPLTYEPHGANSIFRDIRNAGKGDLSASERLQRHSKEMERLGVSGSERALTSVDAAGGYLVPPLYLQEEFVNLARAGRITANLIGARALPPNTDSINVPRMTAGTTVAVQADGGAVSSTDSTFDLITAVVLTLAGQQDVSRQLVDRSIPGVDEVIFADLARAYHFNLDTAVLNSSTTSNLGLLQVSGINSVTYTTSTPTLAGLYSKLADAIQQIGVGIFMPATHIIMHPRRWAFCLASSDSNNRPLIVPNAQGPFASAGTTGGVVAEGPVGSIQGLPVYVDPNIPITFGASTTEDRIIVVAQPELYLWEDQSGPYLETFRDVLSGTLGVRFQLHSYWAQLFARRPKAISVVSGTGLIAPSF